MLIKSKKRFKRILAVTMSLMVAFTYSAPITSFAGTSVNTAEVVDSGHTLWYDKNGNPTDSFDTAAVEMSKTIKKLSGEDEFEITLNVKAKEDVIVNTKETDAAVVLVLDVSGSMVDNKEGKDTRLVAAKKAANTFLESYVKDAGNAKRMISVVEFGSNSKAVSGWIDANGKNDSVSASAKSAINSVSNKFETGLMESYIEWSWNGMSWTCEFKGCELGWGSKPASDTRYVNHTHAGAKDSGGTNIEGALMLTRNILSNGKDNNGAISDIASTNVVMLTDGVPTFHVVNADSSQTATSAIKGTRGGGSASSYSDYCDVPALCSDIKDLGTDVYTVAYGVDSKDKVNGKTVSNWLENDVRVTDSYNASDADELFDAFSKINGSIEDSIVTDVVVIEDPMGDFILFDEENTLNDRITMNGNNLRVGIAKGDVLDQNGKPKPYTYKYKVKLDTGAQNFKEGEVYPTNGTTTLTFKYGADPTEHKVEFTIPSVKGKVPEVPYTIEYYKWDKETKAYPTEPTKTVNGDSVKLWTVIDAPEGYETEYSSDNYHFVQGDSALQMIISKTGNVMRLEYKPDIADVTVKHHYKTDVINEDGSKAEATDYELKSTVSNDGMYVGDRFEAKLISNLDGIEYTLNSKDSNNTVISSLPKDGATINLYYDGVRDMRKTTSVTVNRIYETGSWKLNEETGRYEEVFTAGEPQEYQKSTDVKANSEYKTSTAKDVNDGYKYFGTDKGTYDEKENTISLNLAESDNVINVTFRKSAPKDQLTKTEVTVNHEYYLDKKEIVDGKLVTTIAKTPVVVKEEQKDYFVGEKFTPAENNTYDGILYNSDKGNAEKVVTYELKPGNTEITFSYHYMSEPAKTSVTVNHIYRTHDKVYEDITDNETGEVKGQKVTDVVVIDGTESADISSVTVDNKEEALYEGFAYIAAQNGEYASKKYTFNEKESTRDGKLVLEASGNVINLYYDIKEDTRDAADVSVHHIYVTYLTTVENGKVVQRTEFEGVRAVDKYDGKAGDEVSIAKHQVRDNGDEYKLREDNNFLDDTYMLTPGTNRTIEIVYEREHSDLKATALSVTHKYIEKIMTVVNGVAGYYPAEEAVVGEVKEFTVDGGTVFDKTKEFFVGEKYTIDLAPKYGDVEYTPDSANPKTEITLADGDNNLEFKYYKETELPKTTVTVNHHYSHSITNEVGDTKVETSDTTVQMPNPYVGTDVKASAANGGFEFKEVTVTGTAISAEDTNHDVTMTVSNAAVVVDYYYTKSTDNSVGASYKVNHYYRTLDWNDAKDKEYALDQDLVTSGNSYATKTVTGVPNLKADDEGNATFKLDRAKATSDFTDGYTITLASGANEINFYYTQEIDSRVGTTVKVVHNYYKHDVSGLIPDTTVNGDTTDSAIEALPGVLAGTYEEVFTGKTENAWVGNTFTAQKKTVYGTEENQLTYQFKDANPEDLTIKYLALADAENPNTIVINYVYEYDATENVTMKVNHVYKTHDTYTDKTTEDSEFVMAKYGNDVAGSWDKVNKTFTAKENKKAGFTRQTSDDSMTVSYNAGENEMTVVYDRTVSSRPGGGGGNTGGGGGGNTGGGGNNPGTVIPDEDVPLGDKTTGDVPNEDIIIEDESVPLGDAPVTDGTVMIEEENVPLGALPKTGGAGVLGFFAMGSALLALGVALRRREDKNA